MSVEPDNQPKDHLDEKEFEESLAADTRSNIGDVTGDISVFATVTPAPEAPSSPPLPSWTGKILGHFKLLRAIGEGRMGMVIQAQDINLHRIVALKVLNKRLPGIDEKQRVMQFLREARAAAQIEHPNVVRIYEINQHSGWWYIAMELIEGGNLRSLVKAGGPLSRLRACSFIADAAAALAVAHSLGIVHRDIKPTNLMLTRQGRCKVTDFGLVHIDDPNDPFDFTSKAVGSPQFMAPEMIEHGAVTSAVDIYSLGNTLYYALVGAAPYSGETIEQILRKHLSSPVPDIRTKLPQCPPGLAGLVSRMMAKLPTERPSASDVTAALRAEMVGAHMEEPDIGIAPGASVPQQSDSTILMPEQSGISSSVLAPALPSRLGKWTRSMMIPTIITLIILAILFAAVYLLRIQVAQKPDLGSFFIDAPVTYGLLAPLALPPKLITDPRELGFSWVGRLEVGDMRFAASRTGRYYYPIDSIEALLIRAGDFVGYRTEAEAIADGKSRLP
ncbi:MAG TPA: serine/threonine-protein kinase [Sedimentisphaerales bacterium]|nr:serine/threonine-protein kinase [Sedimentisphaerales bacterium]